MLPLYYCSFFPTDSFPASNVEWMTLSITKRFYDGTHFNRNPRVSSGRHTSTVYVLARRTTFQTILLVRPDAGTLHLRWASIAALIESLRKISQDQTHQESATATVSSDSNHRALHLPPTLHATYTLLGFFRESDRCRPRRDCNWPRGARSFELLIIPNSRFLFRGREPICKQRNSPRSISK